LRYRNKDGSVSPSHLSAAVAALSPGGFRGRRVEIPPEAFPKVKEALYNAYLELGCAEEGGENPIRNQGLILAHQNRF